MGRPPHVLGERGAATDAPGATVRARVRRRWAGLILVGIIAACSEDATASDDSPASSPPTLVATDPAASTPGAPESDASDESNRPGADRPDADRTEADGAHATGGIRTATGSGGAERDPALGRPGSSTGSDPIASKQLPLSTCYREFFVEGFERRFREVSIVDCSQPHDAEVFAIAQYPGRGGLLYPGDDKVDVFSAQVCLAAFEPYVGLEFALSIHRISRVRPDQESWDQGDRMIRCSLYHSDLEPLVGSARGSRR